MTAQPGQLTRRNDMDSDKGSRDVVLVSRHQRANRSNVRTSADIRTFLARFSARHLELSVLGVMVVGEDNSTPDVKLMGHFPRGSAPQPCMPEARHAAPQTKTRTDDFGPRAPSPPAGYNTDAAERLEAVVETICVDTSPRERASGDDVVDQQVLTPGAAFLEHLAHGDARPGGPQTQHRTEPFGLGRLHAVRGTHVEWTIPFSSRWFPSRRLTPTQPRVAVRRLVMGAAGAPNAHAMSGSSTCGYGSNVAE